MTYKKDHYLPSSLRSLSRVAEYINANSEIIFRNKVCLRSLHVTPEHINLLCTHTYFISDFIRLFTMNDNLFSIVGNFYMIPHNQWCLARIALGPIEECKRTMRKKDLDLRKEITI